MSNLIATSSKTKTIQLLFAALEAGPKEQKKALNEYVALLTSNARFRLGNQETVTGRKAILESLVLFCQQVKDIHHDVKLVWEPEENVALLQMEVTYQRLDNTKVTLPAMDFLRFKDDLVEEVQIFMNPNPIFV